MGIFSFGKKRIEEQPYEVDMHSHLIPGVDDGSQTMDETIEMLKRYEDFGFKKLITTPHIMGDFYRNSADNLIPLLEKIKKEKEAQGIKIEIEVAAEYYLDESFMEKLNNNEPLLSFGDNHVLFETSYLNKSHFLYDAIFKMLSLGYKPILAHPERYVYMYNEYEKYREIRERGVLFQINALSLLGYYSSGAQKIVTKLIKDDLVDFISSDCHKMKHLDMLEKVFSNKYYSLLLEKGIRNTTLL